jgi:hypothetical protein
MYDIGLAANFLAAKPNRLGGGKKMAIERKVRWPFKKPRSTGGDQGDRITLTLLSTDDFSM